MKLFYKLLMVFLMCLVGILNGCNGENNLNPNIKRDRLNLMDIVSKEDPALQNTLNAMKEHMVYMKKDGLCYSVVFVLAGSGYPMPVMTNIPCPEE